MLRACPEIAVALSEVEWVAEGMTMTKSRTSHALSKRVCEKFGILLLSPRAKKACPEHSRRIEGSIKTDSSTPLRSARNDETGFSHTLSKKKWSTF